MTKVKDVILSTTLMTCADQIIASLVKLNFEATLCVFDQEFERILGDYKRELNQLDYLLGCREPVFCAYRV